MNGKNIKTQDKERQYIVKEIMQAVESINYGEIVITIHDSKVVQIENREKKRFR